MKNWRELATRCRELPLSAVILALGGAQDPKDSQKWLTPRGPVWLGKGKDSQKFYDRVAGNGGGGAIDLVMSLQRCSFKEAVSLLTRMPHYADAPQGGTPFEEGGAQ